jgi:Tfp pilus assembly protein PilX
MITKTLKSKKTVCQDAGVALLTTMLLLFLMSSMLVGFAVLLISNQQLAGSNNDQVQAFYGAEAGMEQMTASLGDLFTQTYSPTMTQINNIQNNPPSSVPGITYLTGDGKNGYTITPQAVDALGNPAPTISTIKAGPYVGMTAMATEYTLLVNARTIDGREVKLQRTTQTVGIPMFQFGIFSDTDLSFFPGPTFNFGGRTHTNGNLFLAAGSTLTLSDKVDAYKDIIRTNLENGWPTASNYTGTVNITTQPGSSNVRALATNEGSLTGTIGSSGNNNWPNISKVLYSGNLINGQGSAYPALSTGAQKLNLGIVTIGNGTTQAIDLLRRPLSAESANVTGERYFAQASLRVLISDDPSDLMNLPCIDGGTTPLDLSKLTTDPTTWSNKALPTYYAPADNLYQLMKTKGVTPLPLAASGAANPATPAAGAIWNAKDGYFQPTGYPVITGFIKIEEQVAYGNPCGTWKDVTLEILSYGYVGRNINPVPQSLDGVTLNPQWTASQTTGVMEAGRSPAVTNVPMNGNNPVQLAYQNGPAWKNGGTVVSALNTLAAPTGTCLDPHPLAVIRLERVRDNPSSVAVKTGAYSNNKPFNLPLQSTVAQVCGIDPSAVPPQPVAGWNFNDPTQFWPNNLFDTREGTLRDTAMDTATPPRPTLNGVMHYVELDAGNLANWFGGKLGTLTTSGQNTKDPAVAPNDYVFYLSDRRGNSVKSQSIAGGWPPLSYTKNETGEYGWTDIVNSPANPSTGCPNNSLDTGEDPDATAALYTYGASQSYIHAAGVLYAPPGTPLGPGQLGIFKNLVTGNAINNNVLCAAVPPYVTDNIWPMMVAASGTVARENPALFFRRALKIVNGNFLTAVGPCPGGFSCGLTIASENPVYIQGDYNANFGGNQFGSTSIAASVAGDAVTLLSVNWNDENSFSSPYSTAARNGTTTYYRTAIIGGSTIYFPQPSGEGQDYGTDGGVHNFLRYIEAWGGTLNYKGSIVNLYNSRQANGTFKCCNTVYSPPSRGYNFDTNFLTPALLPPRTPLFRDINTTGWTRLMLPSQ